VLRISGPDALTVLGRLFAPARSKATGLSERDESLTSERSYKKASKATGLSEGDEPGGLPERCASDAASAQNCSDDPLGRGREGNPPEPRGSGRPSATRRGAGFVFQPRRLHYGHALDSRGEVLDEVLAVYMPGPDSATGEDVGELHCHAGPGINAALLEAAVEAGAVPAGPGDFTRRAFLNGRLDLTQAEAVAELCDARTGAGARLAAAKLDGALGRETARLRGALEDLRLQCVLDADFPEEEAEHLGETAFIQRLDDCAASLRRLLSAYERARFWREGASAVLAGRVNTGKSSLLNALLGRERAIVSEAPGTTRDYLEESLNLGGLEVRLADTAGLRTGGGAVETEGISRACSLAEQADLVIFVKDVGGVLNPQAADPPDSVRPEDAGFSGNGTLYPEERDFLRLHRDRCRSGRLIAVLNKIDTLPGPAAVRRALEVFSAALGDAVQAVPACAAVSALRGDGLDALSEAVRAALTEQGRPDPGDTVPNLRQSALMRAALEELNTLEEERAAGCPRDMLALRLEHAARLLDEVSGASGNKELLDRIFSSFCIGK
jgi:tRNA modification GTPase